LTKSDPVHKRHVGLVSVTETLAALLTARGGRGGASAFPRQREVGIVDQARDASRYT